MVEVRQPGFDFEVDETPEYDWDNMTTAEAAEATIFYSILGIQQF